MPDVLPQYHEQAHYAEVVALLRAINVKANVTFNGQIYGVQVALEDGREAVWSNYDHWACTLIEADGTPTVSNSGVRADSPPDVAAKVVAFTDYGAEDADA